MRISYEELKNVFSNKNFIKANLKKYFKITGIFAISLLLLALIYENEYSNGFSIKFFRNIVYYNKYCYCNSNYSRKQDHKYF